jgi:hypothetical protein
MDENKNEMNHEEMQPNDALPTSEQLPQDDLTEQGPPIDTPKKKKGGKRVAIIASICLIVLSSVLLVCMAMGLFTPEQPWDKTMNAVFPSWSMLESMATQGGSISLDVSIGSDLGDRVKKEPVRLHAEAALGRGGVMISGSLGGKQHKADLGVIVDATGAQIYSERLLDGGYSIAFDGLMEAIDQSIFALDSGTNYELPQEIYDWLEEYVESLEDPEEDVLEFEEISAVLDQIAAEVMKTAEVTHSDMTLALIDKNTKSKVTMITFDITAIEIVRDILLDQWKNNSVFYDELCDMLDVYSFRDENGEEIDVDDIMDTLYDGLKTGLDDFIQEVKENDFKLKFTHATHAGYTVYVAADAQMTVSDKKGSKTTGATFSWTFTSKPSRDPSYDMVLLTYEGNERDKPLVISHRQEGGHFTFTIDTEQNDISVKGIYLTGANQFILSVDEIDWTIDGETYFDMTDSTFTLTLATGNQRVKRVDNDTDLLSMTVEDMDALGEKLEKQAQQFKVDVNAELGFDLFYDTLIHRQQSILSVHEGMYDYAYDRDSGHLFLATIKNGRHHILMYDLATMEQLAEIKVDREICAMDADGGYLAITDKVNTGEVKSVLDVQIYDAHTLEHIKTLDMNRYHYFPYQYSGDLIVDETRLIYATGDQHCDILFVDIETEELIAKSQGSIYQCSLAIDRENHIVAANKRGISTCVFYMFDSITGELIKKGNRQDSYNQDPIYFDGTSFFCYGYHFMLDGSEQTTNKLVTERRQSDREAKLLAMVYKDEDILVTLEQDNDGMYYTMFYTLADKAKPAPLFEKRQDELYTEIIKIGDGAYIGVTYSGNQTALEYFTIEPSSDFGF